MCCQWHKERLFYKPQNCIKVNEKPYFTPSPSADYSAYYPDGGKTITAGDRSYLLDSYYKISHYHANMAAFIQFGNWFDYLREGGVYDNTRIIIVSDQGRDLGIFDQDATALHHIEYYLPMLLVKDFGSEGFTTSEEFMTNADVPNLAMKGLIENPVNPFAGKETTDSLKTESEKQYVLVSNLWDIGSNNGYQFLPSEWATVTGDVRIKDNWVFHTDLSVLPPDLQN